MGVLMMDTDDKASAGIMEDPAMPAIVEFPTIVKEALAKLGHLTTPLFLCFFVSFRG